jgi:hypothetical protein
MFPVRVLALGWAWLCLGVEKIEARKLLENAQNPLRMLYAMLGRFLPTNKRVVAIPRDFWVDFV